MNSTMPERFYRLLYFIPRPEEDERVCVGLVLKDGRATSVEYDDKLEKVHCFAPDYTKESLAFVLQTIQADAARAAESGQFAEFSPQFRLSTPRALARPIDEHVRAVLRQKFLLKPKSSEHRTKEKGVERKIDRFIYDNLRLPFMAMHRRASVDEVLGFEASHRLPTDLIPKSVSRALIFDSTICLVDGVDLHIRSTDVLVNRINRVAHTYWQYSKVKEYFPRLNEKKIIRAAIVFDGKQETVEPSLRWRADYAFHQFEKDADLTVKAGSEQQELEMQRKLKQLLPQT